MKTLEDHKKEAIRIFNNISFCKNQIFCINNKDGYNSLNFENTTTIKAEDKDSFCNDCMAIIKKKYSKFDSKNMKNEIARLKKEQNVLAADYMKVIGERTKHIIMQEIKRLKEVIKDCSENVIMEELKKLAIEENNGIVAFYILYSGNKKTFFELVNVNNQS